MLHRKDAVEPHLARVVSRQAMGLLVCPLCASQGRECSWNVKDRQNSLCGLCDFTIVSTVVEEYSLFAAMPGASEEEVFMAANKKPFDFSLLSFAGRVGMKPALIDGQEWCFYFDSGKQELAGQLILLLLSRNKKHGKEKDRIGGWASGGGSRTFNIAGNSQKWQT